MTDMTPALDTAPPSGADAPPHAASDAATERNLEARILITVLLALLAWGAAFWTWGLPGLYLPALAMVPVCYLLLILISRG